MVEAFDPYHKWLGIPAEEQPPNHYRLLAIKLFEEDLEVIEHAGDRQMAHLRTFQAGRHGPMSQKLLNEVAAAKICLLNTQKKAAYDAQLRRLLDAHAAGEDTSSHEQLLRELGLTAAGEGYRAGARRAARGTPTGALFAAGVAVLLFGAATAVWWIATVKASRWQPGAERGIVARQSEPVQPVSPKPKEAPRQSPVEVASIKKPEPKSVVEVTPKALPAPPTPSPEAVQPKKKPIETRSPPPPSVSAVAAPPRAAPAPQEPKKLPVPSEATQDQSLKNAQDIYRADYDRAKTAAEKRALARKLLEQATSSELSAADRYVVLRLARDVAVRADDSKLAFEAIDRMAQAYEVEPLAMKADALVAIAKGAKGQAGHKAMAEQAVELAGEALKEDKLDTAAELAKLAQSEASKARDKETVLKARNLSKEILEAQKAFGEVEAALAKLKQTPDDPDANLISGRYYCLLRRDWEKGLPYLIKGSDEKLKALAEEDLKHSPPIWKPAAAVPPPDPVPASIAMKVADAWWDMGQLARGNEREGALWRAGVWYQEVAAGPQAAAQSAKLEKRQQGLAKLGLRIPPKKLLTNSIGMRFVCIGPGEFVMGSTAEVVANQEQLAKDRHDDNYLEAVKRELPLHRVRISRAFYFGVYEVTQGEFQRVMGFNPSSVGNKAEKAEQRAGRQADRAPADSMTYDEAIGFCRRLGAMSEESGARRTYRLPTEAEWEFACRAGTTTLWFFGDVESAGSDYYTIHGPFSPVGQQKPNPWGIFDLAGGVGEWCADWWSAQYYRESPVQDPAGPAHGTGHAVRGMPYGLLYSRSAFRYFYAPQLRKSVCGMRVACEIP